jgi:PDZ domain
VFQPLSQPLLEHFYGRHVASKAPPSLLAEASEFRASPDESIVVLSQVLAADITFGYHSSFCRLKTVNDVEIENIYHLAEVCDNCTDEFVRFDMDRSAPPPSLDVLWCMPELMRLQRSLLDDPCACAGIVTCL